MNFSKKFETIRHGNKQGEDLSELGVERAKVKAQQLFKEIESSPSGSIFYAMSSNVGRARATKDVIEAELRKISESDANIKFIDVNDVESIRSAKGDLSKKYIITGIQYSTALGFNDKTSSLPGFLKYKEVFKNNEDLIGMTWAARPDEIEKLKEKAALEVPGVDVSGINPKDFIETPEDVALNYIRLMRRMTEITEKYFPEHPWKGLQIGHNLTADFAVIAMLGKEISVESIDELGGEFRQFLESAHFEQKDGKIVVQYRDKNKEQEKSLDEIIDDLEKASQKRKQEWETI